jgi:uncharacterized membrane protein
MTLLILGVALFIGVHLIPSAPSLRDRLKKQVGATHIAVFSRLFR